MTYRNSLTPVARVRRAWHLPVASPLSVVRAVTPHSAEALPVAARLFDYFVSKEWLSARPFLNRVPAPEGGVLFFARPKKSTQKKGRPVARRPCASRSIRGSPESTSLCSLARTRIPARPRRAFTG